MKEVLNVGSQVTQSIWFPLILCVVILVITLIYLLYFNVRWHNIKKRIIKIMEFNENALDITYKEDCTTVVYSIPYSVIIDEQKITKLCFSIYKDKILLSFYMTVNGKSISPEFCLNKIMQSKHTEENMGTIFSEIELYNIISLLKKIEKNKPTNTHNAIARLYSNAQGWECKY